MKSFYGRRLSRALSARQKELLETRCSQMRIGSFEKNKKYHLEIGFGTGDFLTYMAETNPHIQFIGCEPFINGVVSFLQKSNAPNIWITTESIHDVIDDLPDFSLDVVYILFPDPWPKTRHHKRRMIQKDFLEKLKIKTKIIYAATDHPGYAEHILALGFNEIDRPDFFVSTRYEIKRKAGDPRYFINVSQHPLKLSLSTHF